MSIPNNHITMFIVSVSTPRVKKNLRALARDILLRLIELINYNAQTTDLPSVAKIIGNQQKVFNHHFIYSVFISSYTLMKTGSNKLYLTLSI